MTTHDAVPKGGPQSLGMSAIRKIVEIRLALPKSLRKRPHDRTEHGKPLHAKEVFRNAVKINSRLALLRKLTNVIYETNDLF
ncbi:MAG TPA: hypothetical protein VGQ55_09325, partial [Pyrinomonadaceae bacterium]|nr:hypothetical protein [Pyrinomonadaceae bacterium]